MFMSKAQPRATKEYYPPHLTGRGSRGLMALAFELFAQDRGALAPRSCGSFVI